MQLSTHDLYPINQAQWRNTTTHTTHKEWLSNRYYYMEFPPQWQELTRLDVPGQLVPNPLQGNVWPHVAIILCLEESMGEGLTDQLQRLLVLITQSAVKITESEIRENKSHLNETCHPISRRRAKARTMNRVRWRALGVALCPPMGQRGLRGRNLNLVQRNTDWTSKKCCF